MFAIKTTTTHGDDPTCMKTVSTKIHGVFEDIVEAREFLMRMYNRTHIFENNEDTFVLKFCNDMFSLYVYDKENKTWQITQFKIYEATVGEI